jgi:hypothetical protein
VNTLPTVVAAAFALVVFMVIANGVLVHYSKGVARTAVDEAVRVAVARDGDPSECATTARSVLDELLGGSFGDDLDTWCTTVDGVVTARVEGSLPAVLPPLPSFELRVAGSAVLGD